MKDNKGLKIVSFIFAIFSTIAIIVGSFTIFISGNIYILDLVNGNKETAFQYLGGLFFAIGAIFSLVRMIRKKSNTSLYVFNILFILMGIIFYALFIYYVIYLFFQIYETIGTLVMPIIALLISLITFMLSIISGIQVKKKEKNESNALTEENFEQTPMNTLSNSNNIQQPQRMNTVDIADRVQRMRQDLIEGNFQDYEETEENMTSTTEPPVQPVENNIIAEKQKSQEQYQPKVIKSITEEYGEIKPKDPYQEVILPRRMSGIKYEGEPTKKYSQEGQREQRRPQLDGSYRDKLFVGEGDRIWEVFKSVERPQPETVVSNFKKKDGNLNSVRNVKSSNTMEINSSEIQDPLNDNNPTIDWDE